MGFVKAQLHKIVTYAVAPFLYHLSTNTTVVYYCETLIDVVDAYAILIITILFILSLVLFKNYLFSLISFLSIPLNPSYLLFLKSRSTLNFNKTFKSLFLKLF